MASILSRYCVPTRKFVAVSLFLALSFLSATHGPEKGALVIVGGGQTRIRSLGSFSSRAGGKDQQFEGM
jgi:hypothetical protein